MFARFNAAPRLAGVYLSKLGAEEKNLCRIVNPEQQRN